jgi:hypothetical protein
VFGRHIKRAFGAGGLKAFEEAEAKGWVVCEEEYNELWYEITKEGFNSLRDEMLKNALLSCKRKRRDL